MEPSSVLFFAAGIGVLLFRPGLVPHAARITGYALGRGVSFLRTMQEFVSTSSEGSSPLSQYHDEVRKGMAQIRDLRMQIRSELRSASPFANRGYVRIDPQEKFVLRPSKSNSATSSSAQNGSNGADAAASSSSTNNSMPSSETWTTTANPTPSSYGSAPVRQPLPIASSFKYGAHFISECIEEAALARKHPELLHMVQRKAAASQVEKPSVALNPETSGTKARASDSASGSPGTSSPPS